MPANDRDYSDVPEAASTELFVCDHCRNVHVVLFDDDDKPMAMFNYDAAGWLRLFGGIKDALKGIDDARSPSH